MAAALRAPLAIADGRLVIGADARRAVRHFESLGFPQREGIDRAGRPVPAGIAVAVAHRYRFARDLEPHFAAKTRARIHLFTDHDSLSECLWVWMLIELKGPTLSANGPLLVKAAAAEPRTNPIATAPMRKSGCARTDALDFRRVPPGTAPAA